MVVCLPLLGKRLYILLLIVSFVSIPTRHRTGVGAENVQYFVTRQKNQDDVFGLLDKNNNNLSAISKWCGDRGSTSYGNGKYTCVCRHYQRTFVEKRGRCLSNAEARTSYGGCGIYTESESVTADLTVLDLTTSGSRDMPSGTKKCTIDLNYSYMCDGKRWKRIETDGIIDFGFKGQKKNIFKWTTNNADRVYQGNIIRLNVSCEKPKTNPDKSCFLFKAAGTLHYNMSIPTLVSTSQLPSTMLTVTSHPSSTTASSDLLSPSTSWPVSEAPTSGATVRTTRLIVSTSYGGLEPSSSSLVSSMIRSLPTSTPTTSYLITMRTIPMVVSNSTAWNIHPSSATSRTVLSSTQAPFIPPVLTTPKPKGKPDAQSSSASTGTIAGAAVAGLLVLIIAVVALIIFCQRRKARSPSPAKPSGNQDQATGIGNDNPTYGKEDDIILTSYPDQLPGNGRTSRSGTDTSTPRNGSVTCVGSADDDYDYAAVDGYPRNRYSTPVYQGLARPQGDQTYTTLDQDLSDPNTSVEGRQEPVYNILEGPDSEGNNPTEPNSHGAHTEPLYNVLEDPSDETGKEYRSLTNDRQDHEYGTLEPDPVTQSDNDPIYNVLEDADMDYDNVSDDEGPNLTRAQQKGAYEDPHSPDYAKLEGPHTTAGPQTRRPVEPPTYDALERPLTATAINNNSSRPLSLAPDGNAQPQSADYAKLEGPHTTSNQPAPKGSIDSPEYDVLERPCSPIYQPLHSQHSGDELYQPLDNMDQQPVYQALNRDSTA